MTQKELLYLEDAIKHEENLINICNDNIECMEDEELISFMKKEIKKHEKFKEKLINFMEDKSNE